MSAAFLERKVKAVCPVVGVSVGNPSNRNTWRIDYASNATAQEIAAAQALVAALPEPLTEVITEEEKEEDCKAALNGGAQRIDLQRLIKAKAISDEAYRLGKAPGALTAPELQALRNRIAAIYKAL